MLAIARSIATKQSNNIEHIQNTRFAPCLPAGARNDHFRKFLRFHHKKEKPLPENLFSDSGPTIQLYQPPEVLNVISGPETIICETIFPVKDFFIPVDLTKSLYKDS